MGSDDTSRDLARFVAEHRDQLEAYTGGDKDCSWVASTVLAANEDDRGSPEEPR